MKKILFVCWGNICRSPGAEAVFKSLVRQRDLSAGFVIDSAGTIDYHEGEPADLRMQEHAGKRGYLLTSRSRPFNPGKDFDQFDLIVAMDDNNVKDLAYMARNGQDIKKIVKMTDFSRRYSYNEVPDPYFGGADGFELVLDLLEDASEGLLRFLRDSETKQSPQS